MSIHLVNETQLIGHPQHPKFIWIQDFSVLLAVLGLERKDTYGTSAYIYPARLAARYPRKSFWVDLGGVSFIIRNGIVKRIKGPPVPFIQPHNKVHYISLYEVSRHYGGPEEGGWWYDHWELQRVLLKARFSRIMKELRKLQRKYEPERTTRYNVNGGDDAQVIWERQAGEMQTKGRPHYE